MTTKHPVGRGNKAALPWDDLLAEIRLSGSMEEACRKVGECSRTVARHIAADPELAERVEQARQDARDVIRHGTPSGYRRCHCDVCRFTNATRRHDWSSRAGRRRTSAPCPFCDREVGLRAGLRYAHYSAPGVVCRGSESSNGRIQLGGVRPRPAPRAETRETTLTERIEQEIAMGTPTRQIMARLDVDYAAVKNARDAMDVAS